MTRRSRIPQECLDELLRRQAAMYQFPLKTAARRDAARSLDVYLWALSCAGWSMLPMATCLSMSPQAVHHRIRRILGPIKDLPDVPLTPAKVKPKAQARHVELLLPEEVTQLRGLFEQARRVNGATPADHPDRAASTELAAVMHALVERGVQKNHIAKAIGVTPNAIHFRLARHGYEPGPPSMSGRYTGQQSPSMFGEKTHCKRGHPLSGDNLWNGTDKAGKARRMCRACSRKRSLEYYHRRKQAVSA